MNHNKDNTRRRPSEVDEKYFNSEWDRIFGKKERDKIDDTGRNEGISKSLVSEE